MWMMSWVLQWLPTMLGPNYSPWHTDPRRRRPRTTGSAPQKKSKCSSKMKDRAFIESTFWLPEQHCECKNQSLHPVPGLQTILGISTQVWKALMTTPVTVHLCEGAFLASKVRIWLRLCVTKYFSWMSPFSAIVFRKTRYNCPRMHCAIDLSWPHNIVVWANFVHTHKDSQWRRQWIRNFWSQPYSVYTCSQRAANWERDLTLFQTSFAGRHCWRGYAIRPSSQWFKYLQWRQWGVWNVIQHCALRPTRILCQKCVNLI
jgi:hypothetical protein